MYKTVQEQKAWEHYKAIEEENYLLRKRIAKLEKENKSLKHHNRALTSLKKKNETRMKEGREKWRSTH